VTASWVLDTDTCIHALRGHSTILARLRARSPATVLTTAMTVAELRFGSLKSKDPASNLARVSAFLEPISVLDFDAEAATHHAEIRWALREEPIGERDLVIASVVRARGMILVTGNRGEFARVPGLAMEDWAEE